MTEHESGQDPRDSSGHQDDAGNGEGHERPVFRDKRKVDPETGEVRGESAGNSGSGTGAGSSPAGAAGSNPDDDVVAEAESILDEALVDGEAASADAMLAAERLADLQRLQAEYTNYRRRVERDRDVARSNAVISMISALLPVLDDVEAAKQAGDLEGGPFAAISEKLDSVLAAQGLERYGEVGTTFDPKIHEALMQQPSDEVESGQVSHVLRSGYRVGDRIVRAAQVGVAA